MSIEKKSFGKLSDGREATMYTIRNAEGMQLDVTDYGATMVRILVPDKNHELVDVTLGYETLEEYVANDGHFGCVIGRNGNRIAKACFEIGGKVWQLEKNDNGNNLHSGPDYFGKRLWDTVEVTDSSVTFALEDEDGRQGYPGNFRCTITYTLTKEQGVQLHYTAVCDQDTIANLTNHAYFNLEGQGSGTVYDQYLTIRAKNFTPASDYQAIPTGEIAPVAGTPLDFTSPVKIGERINENDTRLTDVRGYDINYADRQEPGEVECVAQAWSEKTGIMMEVWTDLPGVQLYSGNFIPEGRKGKDGAVYGPRWGFCLETQYYPNAINQKGFASPLLKAGEVRDTTTEYRFSLR